MLKVWVNIKIKKGWRYQPVAVFGYRNLLQIS
jgi:hypothetical protein